MAWVTRRGLEQHRRAVEWRGRAGRLTIGRCAQKGSLGPNASPNSLCLIGVHRAHGELHAESMHDAGTLVRTRVRPSAFVAMGDRNADISECRVEGGAHEPDGPRTPECEAVHALAESLGGRVIRTATLPESLDHVGGFRVQEAAQAYSRRPQGATPGLVNPSLLDYAIAQESTDGLDSQGIERLHLDWRLAPADHAWLYARIAFRTKATRKTVRRWAPADEDAVRADLLRRIRQNRRAAEVRGVPEQAQDAGERRSEAPRTRANASARAVPTGCSLHPGTRAGCRAQVGVADYRRPEAPGASRRRRTPV